MATITETASTLTPGGAKTGLEFRLRVMEPDHKKVLEVAADPDNPTTTERIFVTASHPVIRSDGRPGRLRRTEGWVHLSAETISGLSEDEVIVLRGLSKKLLDSLQPEDL